jgi:hypothetical protein
MAVAREVLVGIPGTITQSELGRQVQQRSGVYTRAAVSEWLPGVLAELDDPALTSRVRADAPPAAARARTAARAPRAARVTAPKRVEAPPAICPTCFMQLPASGRCDTCG